MTLHLPEGLEQSLAEMLWLLKVAVVGGVVTRVIPNALRSIEFWAIRRQLEHLYKTPVVGKPLIGFPLFMVGGIVLNQKHPVSPPIKRRHQDLVQKRHIRFPLKIVLLVEVDEFCRIQAHRPKDFLRVSLPAGGNVRLAAYPGPSGVQGGRLPERRLVLKDNNRPFALGFFLRRG